MLRHSHDGFVTLTTACDYEDVQRIVTVVHNFEGPATMVVWEATGSRGRGKPATNRPQSALEVCLGYSMLLFMFLVLTGNIDTGRMYQRLEGQWEGQIVPGVRHIYDFTAGTWQAIMHPEGSNTAPPTPGTTSVVHSDVSVMSVATPVHRAVSATSITTLDSTASVTTLDSTTSVTTLDSTTSVTTLDSTTSVTTLDSTPSDDLALIAWKQIAWED
ncbi:hypothetical protein B0H21DRAFT_824848 [Amylocystis lapponica]|nr:hypothetical protein B0H21DRAFT_824848 [Amylocystis lapponica]